MNIVVFGAHCDDAESGCGGLILRASAAGHAVWCAYAVSECRGRLVGDKPEGAVRQAEALVACAVLGAKPHFFDWPAGWAAFDRPSLQLVSDFLRQVDADVVVAHWPLDTHPDHVAVGALATQAVVGNPGVALAYFEVLTGMQTFAFEPNRYVDITDFAQAKKRAVECHASQNPGTWWPRHEDMQRFRGAEIGVPAAEGYYLAVSTPPAEALFTPRTSLHPSGSRTARATRHEDVELGPPNHRQ